MMAAIERVDRPDDRPPISPDECCHPHLDVAIRGGQLGDFEIEAFCVYCDAGATEVLTFDRLLAGDYAPDI